MPRDKPSFLCFALSVTALLLVPAANFAYSQAASSSLISVLSSSSFTDDLGDYHVVGEVKNNSPTDSINYVKIVATFYDNTGKVVGTDFTYSNIDVLRPAEKSSFEIILNDAAQSQSVIY
jgi:hypothetical protein